LNELEKGKDPLIRPDQKDNILQANDALLPGFERTGYQSKTTVFLKTIGSKKNLGLSLIMIWAAGLIFLLIRICLGLYGAHRLKKQGKRISGSLWQQLLQRFLNAISIRRKISLFSHDKVNTPLTWGVIKPVVILPAEAGNWTKDQCSSALFHELSHIKRSDFLIKILSRLSCSLYWFNPLSWFVFRLMKKEQEKACDELVLKAGVKPSTYAANLLSIKKAGQIQWNPPAAVLGAVGKSQLNERLLAILKHQLKPKEVKMKTKIFLSFFVIAAITFIGLARPSQSAASSGKIFPDKDTVLTDTQNSYQDEIVQEKQKKQEKKKTKKVDKKESQKKKDSKKGVIHVSKDGKPAYINIWISKDANTKHIHFEGKPFIYLKKHFPEKDIVFSISGKDVELIKGKEGHWTLQADKIDILKDKGANVIKLDKGNYICIETEKGKEGKDIYYVIKSGELHLEKHAKSPLSYNIHIEGGKGEKKILHVKPYVDVHIDTHVEMLPVVKPHVDVGVDAHVEMLPVFRLKTEQKELREKLKKLQEKLEKIKELKIEAEKDKAREEALKDIEEVLKDMIKELEKKTEKRKDLNLRLATELRHNLAYNIRSIQEDKIKRGILIDKIKLGEKIEGDIAFIKVKGDEKVICVVDKDGTIQVIMKGKLDSESKGKYKEILKKIKEGLPKDYKAKSEIDEEGNTVTITITTGKKDDKSKKDNKKLVKEITDNISKLLKKTLKDEKKILN
jgi:beta-lactamase regulating signal transducer with metallopeptidase domain